ncbi:MAG: hypothetical protein V2I34_12595 [Bacteroidales bacterium]|jgi:hypothetical protein|nr:hypothetical protein [Bacteroidales bacterium]
MAGIPSFFKQYRPRGFNYTPMYYDANKERREERERQIKAELGIRDEGSDREYVPRITRGSMSGYFHQQKTRVQRYTVIRLVVIVLVLFLITYIFLYI